MFEKWLVVTSSLSWFLLFMAATNKFISFCLTSLAEIVMLSPCFVYLAALLIMLKIINPNLASSNSMGTCWSVSEHLILTSKLFYSMRSSKMSIMVFNFSWIFMCLGKVLKLFSRIFESSIMLWTVKTKFYRQLLTIERYFMATSLPYISLSIRWDIPIKPFIGVNRLWAVVFKNRLVNFSFVFVT